MTTPSASQSFIHALEPQRDALFARAHAGASSAVAAEAALLSAIHAAFAAVLADPSQDAATLVASRLPPVAAPAAEAMPADVWARVAAAVQIEAAKSAGSPGLNPDHVLLSPDPLLAPKKIQRETDFFEGLDLSPASRFVVASVIAIVIGVALTVYIATRNSPSPPPATSPAPTSHAE